MIPPPFMDSVKYPFAMGNCELEGDPTYDDDVPFF
jgi:hypothetical protein